MDRTILHVDGNHFYANIEKANDPSLKGKPMAVGGDVEQRHGIILAKSDEAKACGVKTGEALWQAREKCWDIIIVPPNYPLYIRYSRLLHNIFEEYSDKVQAFGLDESWVDVTNSMDYLNMSGEEIAHQIRERAISELGITVSVGVSWNKIFAKLGSDYKKPNAVTIFTKENYMNKVWPLPAEDLLGVGRATQIKLNARGIKTIGDLANTSPDMLQSWLHKWGLFLHVFANGMDTSPVTPTGFEEAIKSIGNSTTTPRDLVNDRDVRITFTALCESVATRLREHGLLGKTVQISLRDNKLFSFERQMTLQKPTCIATELLDAAMILFKKHYRWDKPLRSIEVRAMNLVSEHTSIQLDLFDNEEKRIREEKLERTVDNIRKRFGHYAILRGMLCEDKELGHLNPRDDHTIHPVGYF